MLARGHRRDPLPLGDAERTRLFGEPVWTTTHGGHTLALANNPVYYAEVVNGPAGSGLERPEPAALVRQVDRVGRLSRA